MFNWLYWRRRCRIAEAEVARRGAMLDEQRRQLKTAAQMLADADAELVNLEARAKAHSRLLTHDTTGSCVWRSARREV